MHARWQNYKGWYQNVLRIEQDTGFVLSRKRTQHSSKAMRDAKRVKAEKNERADYYGDMGGDTYIGVDTFFK